MSSRGQSSRCFGSAAIWCSSPRTSATWPSRPSPRRTANASSTSASPNRTWCRWRPAWRARGIFPGCTAWRRSSRFAPTSRSAPTCVCTGSRSSWSAMAGDTATASWAPRITPSTTSARCACCPTCASTCRVTAADVPQAVEMMAADPLPNYLRLNAVADLPGETPRFAPWRKLKSGRTCVVIGTGPVLGNLYELGDQALLDELEIWNVGLLPLEEMPADLLASIRDKQRVVAIEEHYRAVWPGGGPQLPAGEAGRRPALVHQPSRPGVSERAVRQPALASGRERPGGPRAALAPGTGRPWLRPHQATALGRHRLLQGRAGDSSDVRALVGGVCGAGRRPRDHLRQRRQPR